MAQPDNRLMGRLDNLASLEIIEVQRQSILRLQAENDALKKKLYTPEVTDFVEGTMLEAAHQRDRWGSDHDEGKEPSDWFWLIGYLAGKALRSADVGDVEKHRHHCISTAAVLANWHSYALGRNNMRPGVRLKE